MKRFLFIVVAGLTTGSAAAASAHEFLVYFRLDSAAFYRHLDRPDWSVLVVKDAACYARSASVTRVHVVAHADTSGDPAYNAGLSRRRAETVAALLVQEGVDRAKITLEGRGEAQPAVATGDRVQEPLNRRATIDINFGGPGPSPVCEGPTLPKLPPR